MNIFVVSNNHIENAQMLDDKRLIKMILEHTQILSTALQLNGLPGVYKITHKNHPCVKWTAVTPANWDELFILTRHLLIEYTVRFGKVHGCEIKVDQAARTFFKSTWYKSYTPLTPYVNCSLYKDNPDTFAAYKATMNHKWSNDKRTPKWTNRNPPAWRQTLTG